MEINLTGVNAAETQTSTFKRVEPGVHTATITKVEGAKAGARDVVKVTFASKEADAEFSHNYFVTEAALPRIQYLIEKFTGAPLEGKFSVDALAAILVGKEKSIVVDGQVRPRQKDGKWFNNTYATLRFAGYVDPQGNDAEPRIDRSQEMNLEAANGGAAESSAQQAEDNDLPF